MLLWYLMTERRNLFMNNLPYSQLYIKYQEALETIFNQQIEIKELKQEIDDYCQALDELTDVVGTM